MKSENNPARYSEMSKPKTGAEADAAIAAFYKEVSEARIRHKLADVHVIVRVIVDVGNDDAAALSIAHMGAMQEAEGMCAYAFARSAETRRAAVDGNKVAGARSAAQLDLSPN